MRRIILSIQAAALSAALFLAGAPARAQPALRSQGPSAMEFRGYGFIAWGLEDDIWRLAADGRATMIYVIRRGLGDRSASGGES